MNPMFRCIVNSLLVTAAFLLAACGGASPAQNQVSSVAGIAFNAWATTAGVPYQDMQITEISNDGFFAEMRVIAWFRLTADADWEEREAVIECRKIGVDWRCGQMFDFVLTAAEKRRRSAAATAVAAPTVTAEAITRATAEAWVAEAAMVRATEIAQLRERTEEILIPAGPFQMGCDSNNLAENGCDTFPGQSNELPLHTVMVSTYSIDKYEVTNALYRGCVEMGGCTYPEEWSSLTRDNYYGDVLYNDFPVINVDWSQAVAFCTWAGKRLPTEAEWEKAARGASDTRMYPWGDSAPDSTLLNFGRNVGDTTYVGAYPYGASPYGVMDMAGNVSEWVSDWRGNDYYSLSPADDPQGPVTGESRVLRGGSLANDDVYVRSANRGDRDPAYGNDIIGFRCARTP